jgi:hypothetical protein
MVLAKVNSHCFIKENNCGRGIVCIRLVYLDERSSLVGGEHVPEDYQGETYVYAQECRR